MNSEIMFSGELTGGLFAILAVCILCPVLYLIYYTFKKKINLLAVLAGIVGSVVFGYFVMNVVCGIFVPKTGPEENAVSRALVTALCTGVVEGGGFFAAMWLMRKKWDELGTPISYALGYPLVSMLVLRGANAFFRLGEAYTVNVKGIETVLSSVEGESVEVLRQELNALAQTPPYQLFISAIDCIVLFAVSAALCRIMWYAVHEEGRRCIDLALLGVILRFAVEYPTLLGNVSITAYCIMHYIPAALCIAFAVFLAFKLDEKEIVSAGPLNKKLL